MSQSPSISADGRHVAFATGATNLDPADGDELSDVYVRDTQGATTALVSRASGATGVKGDRSSPVEGGLAISGDGAFVAFN